MDDKQILEVHIYLNTKLLIKNIKSYILPNIWGIILSWYFCLIYYCISHFSVAAIGHHNQGNLQKSFDYGFDYGSKGRQESIKATSHGSEHRHKGKPGGRRRKLRYHGLSHKHETEGVNWKWDQNMNSQSWSPVTCFLHQIHEFMGDTSCSITTINILTQYIHNPPLSIS